MTDPFQQAIYGTATGITLYQTLWQENGDVDDFHIVLCNPAAAQTINLTPEDIVGQRLLSMPLVDRNGPLFTFLTELASNRKPSAHFEFFDPTRKNHYDVRLTKQGPYIVQTTTDVTATKAILHELETQKAMLNSVFHSARNGLVIYEAVRNEEHRIIDFKPVFWNRAAVNQTEAESLTDRVYTLLEINPALQLTPIFDRLINVVENDTTFDLEYEFHNHFFDISVSKLGDGLLAWLLNIDDFKQVQDQQAYLLKQLMKSNENLQQFAYTASHDLQEPLRKIQSFGDLLVSQYGDQLNNQAQDLLRRMQGAAGRMQVFIRDLLAYSRLTTKRETAKPIDLSGLLKDVLSDFESIISEKQADIHVDRLPVIQGEPLQWQQLFHNLLSNALKFTRETREGQPVPPHITITCRLLTSDQLTQMPELQRDQVYYAITIEDNGIGFDEKYGDRIFELFQRLHGKSQYAGTGIGLAIVKKVADNHNAVITASGKPGEGATFTLYLPQTPVK
ncbi:PAS domain-containing sensor histidine kinase [Arsenicibacter rosenii]|uniref:PAS domain-containing sensor histidine kinase n=1 Tax=Arsenicibacter rosenii TaxID=1750698 RepID=UPI0015A68BE0|nr:ATP-binding protein [Arsenicibacter rosenii]